MLAPVVEIARATSAKESVVPSADVHAESNATSGEPTCDFPAKNEGSQSVSADVFIRRDYTPLDVPPWEFLSAFYPDPHEDVRLRAFGPKAAPDEPRFSAEKVLTRRASLAVGESSAQLQSLNRSRGLYFVVNGGGDRDEQITRFNAFFAEDDAGAIAEQHAKLDACPLPPSVRVETVAFDTSRRFTVAEMLAAFPAVPEEKPEHLPRVKSLNDLTGDFEAYKRELGARIASHSTARRNGAGNWDCQALCHGGKGSTGLFYSPKTNVIHCNREPSCDLSTIAAQFGMPPYSAQRAPSPTPGRERGVI
jgi:hypothetical protein